MNSGDNSWSGSRWWKKIIRETPVTPLRNERIELFAKLEYLNASASVKDRPAFGFSKALSARRIEPGTTIIECPPANFACALAGFL